MHFPAAWRAFAGDLREMVRGGRRAAPATLMAQWMRVGFVHGVMNTDNMSILGLTIDYGPYGWLEGYDPAWTPNTTDAQGRRYRYGNQPQHRAVERGAARERARSARRRRRSRSKRRSARTARPTRARSARMLTQKLGLAALEGEEDETLANELFDVLERGRDRHDALLPAARERADGRRQRDGPALVEPLRRAFYSEDAFAAEHVARTAGVAAALHRAREARRRDATRSAASA